MTDIVDYYKTMFDLYFNSFKSNIVEELYTKPNLSPEEVKSLEQIAWYFDSCSRSIELFVEDHG
jgi:hypothetical protein